MKKGLAIFFILLFSIGCDTLLSKTYTVSEILELTPRALEDLENIKIKGQIGAI